MSAERIQQLTQANRRLQEQLTEANVEIARLTAATELAEKAEADAELGAYVRQHVKELHGGWQIDMIIAGAPSIETLDDAISATRLQEQPK